MQFSIIGQNSTHGNTKGNSRAAGLAGFRQNGPSAQSLRHGKRPARRAASPEKRQKNRPRTMWFTACSAFLIGVKKSERQQPQALGNQGQNQQGQGNHEVGIKNSSSEVKSFYSGNRCRRTAIEDVSNLFSAHILVYGHVNIEISANRLNSKL